jgi:hypothetical protein
MNNDDNTERMLKSLTRKPPPPDLRKRILSAAHQKERQSLVSTPTFRWAMAAGCFLVMIALVLDMMTASSEAAYLNSLMNNAHSKDARHEKYVLEAVPEIGGPEDSRRFMQWLLRNSMLRRKEAKCMSLTSLIKKFRENIDEL